MIELALLRLRKLLAVLIRPGYRRAFMEHRVLPSIELSGFPYRDDYGTVFDVGANRGQFSLFARGRFPRAAIRAFEPVPAAAEAYARLFAADPTVRHVRIALGARTEERAITVPANDDGASFVVALGDAGRIVVPVETLDTHAAEVRRPALLKIDVQGFELEVLLGATRALESIDDLLVEVNFAPMREVPSAGEVIAWLMGAGFQPISAHASGPSGDVFFRRASDVR